MSQREIKFRAWFVNYHDTGFIDEFDVNQDGVVFINVFGKEEMYPLDSEHVTLEQYTGLKDKNGVDIYEGDIVSLGKDGKSFLKDCVVYSVGGFHLMMENVRDNFLEWVIESEMEDIEVVGNIHEHPELLEAE